jgi:hypothetical protein
VGRAAQSIFAELGRVLEEAAQALRTGDGSRAMAALEAARRIDRHIRALEDALEVGRETARSAPLRRETRADLERYARMAGHLDFAVRNSRVLARHVTRFMRSGRPAPDELPPALEDLNLAVWALGGVIEDPDRAAEVRTHASRAAARAAATVEQERELLLVEVVGQVRGTAVDLVRAAEAAGAVPDTPAEPSTEELVPPDLMVSRGATA